MTDPATFPARLRAAREAAGLTQAALAEAVGWSQGRIARLERPSPWRPRRETVLRLAVALAVPTAALDPELSAPVPEHAVFLAPDPDLVGAWRPLRPADADRLAELAGTGSDEPIGHERLAELAGTLRAAGVPLCLMP